MFSFLVSFDPVDTVMNKRYYWLMKHSNLFHCHLLIFALKCTLTVSWSVPALAQASPMKTIDSKCIFLHSESKENFQQTNWIILFFLIKKCLFVCLFLAVLGPHCCAQLPLSCREPGLFSSCGAGFSLRGLCCGKRLQGSQSSVVAARGLSSCVTQA